MTHTSIRIEPIDHRHPAWSDVLAAIFRGGKREAMLLLENGWLSSRQTVLAAFDGQNVIGHLCFRIEPTRCDKGLAVVKSRVDSFSVESQYSNHDVDEMLIDGAESRAKMMKCSLPQIELAAC